MITDKITLLKDILTKEVFIKNGTEQIDLKTDPESWIFDFRKVLMRGSTANLISDIFYEMYCSVLPFQIGTLEIGGVPLATSLMNKFYTNGYTDINAFFIRKSRKKSGLMRMIEGQVVADQKIVLVDDTMNSGSSLWRQIEVLEALGHRVDTVWSIIRYRDHKYYQRFHNRGIKVHSLFTLDDFTDVLGNNIKNIADPNDTPPLMPFIGKWIFKAPKPSLGYVIGKSQPALDSDTIYLGSDNETFFAINQEDGAIRWKFSVGKKTAGKSIFSNPLIYKNMIIFGSYDGNIYALNKTTGKKCWVSFEADYVGSSPAAAEDLNLIFVGLEFGLFRKHGGIVALEASTGKTIWTDYSHPAFTHCSPTYISPYQQVVIGSNDGVVRLYDAKSGDKLWDFTTFGGSKFDNESDAGFGEGEIKEAFAYDEIRDYIIFGATDGFLYILERSTGHLVKHFKCEFGIWATPLVYGDRVYFTSLDKRVRCIDLDTYELIFYKNVDGTRIFSSPVIIEGSLYVGTNAGRLHELDPETGDQLGYYQTLERITNSPLYNQNTKQFFVPTYANEIICISKLVTNNKDS